MADGKLTEVTAMFWGGKWRKLRIILEFVAFMAILIWLLASRHAHAQQAQVRSQQTADWQAREKIGALQYHMDTLLGPDGTGSQSGTIKMINDHISNTDTNVRALNSFMDKVLGAFGALSSLTLVNLVRDWLSGKKVKPQ
jgi:hypothetical protein